MHAHFATKFDPKDVPTPTTRTHAAPASGTLRRGKTLTRPERGVAPVPLINPQNTGRRVDAPAGLPIPAPKESGGFDAWRFFAAVITCWAPSFMLKSIGGLKDKQVQQAWREKIALCFIIIVMGGAVGFATVGFQKVFCPTVSATNVARYLRVGDTAQTLGIQGIVFNVSKALNPDGVDFAQLTNQLSGQDITNLFQREASYYTACHGKTFTAAVDPPCSAATPCPLGPLNSSVSFTSLQLVQTHGLIGYDWEQVAGTPGYIVMDGAVLNMKNYLTLHPKAISTDPVDLALRTMLVGQPAISAKDGTRLFYSHAQLQAAVPCLVQRYGAGNIDKITAGCFLSDLLLYAGLIVIMGLVLIRFVMACLFNWFISERLAGPPSSSHFNRSAISPGVLPEGANMSVNNQNGQAPWAGSKGVPPSPHNKLRRPNPTATAAQPIMSLAKIGAELFAVCLVTCYSEGEESLRTTLDSISATTYGDNRKLLWVVADGMITGHGEKRSTPDMCVGMLEADPRFGNPIPMGYFAVGSGAKAENRAMVYAGHYTKAGRRTPMVIVVKCGTEKEAASDKKPGNRGKRDSQLILMNFFSRVTYNDRMSPLDFDLFRKIHILMGVTPDFFEVCLMVDADTKVFPDSLKHMVNCMQHDPFIMGVCGETRIANKRQSWVTAIQVYEYFISHHMAKAFEAVFGGVTCLPGCFSMFRLKARKSTGDDWIPLVIKPEIVTEYSQCEVNTLHQKNLLLLGEDRFLTTILLRTFPNRKMMFLPQARCRTVVPDTFKILLSQRRRWINSTIHNLMELVLVRDLCGTFCFSMQFVVFMDLLGTVVLPVAISLTYVLIGTLIWQPPKTFQQAIPAMLLGAVLGLPAVLILITTRKVVYITWMLVYLLALPIWNFILPVYAFWNFDDFSWGETRKVEGEGKDEGHGGGGGVVNANAVPLRRWEDWERSRLRKLKREERRRKDFERQFPSGYASEGNDDRLYPDNRSQYGSETNSIYSEEDQWGTQIGGYNEFATTYPPPPVGLHIPETVEAAEIIGGHDLEAMLEMGFDEPPSRASPASMRRELPKTKYKLSDSPNQHRPAQSGNGYTPLARAVSPNMSSPSLDHLPDSALMAGSSAVGPEHRTHTKRRSGGRSRPHNDQYGPLGPLDPSS